MNLVKHFLPSVNPENELLKRAFLYSTKIFVILRLITFAWVAFLSMFASRFSQEPNILFCPPNLLSENSGNTLTFLLAWIRWDTTCYLSVAELGYKANSITTVWPPLYPMLIRLFTFITPPPILAGLLVASMATWLAFVLLYWLISLDYDEKTAQGTIALLAIFPASFFLVAGYTESLFMALAFASLLSARYRRWGWAGLFAALATLARNQGLVLSLVLLWEGFQQYRKQPDDRTINFLKVLLASSLPGFVFGAWAIYTRTVFGAAWPWQTLNVYWEQHWGFPWQGIIGNFQRLFLIPGANRFLSIPSATLDLILSITVLAALLFNRRPMRSSYLVFAWSTVLISLMKLGSGDILISFARYLIPVFPFFIIMSPIVQKRRLWLGIFAVSLMVQGIMLAMFYFWAWVD